MEETNIRAIIRDAIQEFTKSETARQEPAYKAELVDERKRREQLEQRVNQLAEEARKSQMQAEQAERENMLRSELQRLGVAKIDLAFKAVKDDIQRNEDGRLIAKSDQGEIPAKEYLKQFVTENPELLPSRIAGGSGAATSNRGASNNAGSSADLDKLRPGMNPDELERIRQEISRVAAQTLKGQ
jgi:G3E family GTPase